MPVRDYPGMSARSGPPAGARGQGSGTAAVAEASDGGLSSAEAEDRPARYGPNELPPARRTPLWQMILGQLRDPLVIVLLVAAVLTLATGDWTDAGVIRAGQGQGSCVAWSSVPSLGSCSHFQALRLCAQHRDARPGSRELNAPETSFA